MKMFGLLISIKTKPIYSLLYESNDVIYIHKNANNSNLCYIIWCNNSINNSKYLKRKNYSNSLINGKSIESVSSSI